MMDVRDNCIFCRILAGNKPVRMVYEGEEVVAFEDIRPQAPVHLLVVPRHHLPSLREATERDEAVLGRMLTVASRLARDREIESQGYRVVINNGSWAGQSVDHLHLHVLGGRVFHWPPG
jgi:histidine triad (HIT) family protein